MAYIDSVNDTNRNRPCNLVINTIGFVQKDTVVNESIAGARQSRWNVSVKSYYVILPNEGRASLMYKMEETQRHGQTIFSVNSISVSGSISLKRRREAANAIADTTNADPSILSAAGNS